MRRLGSVLVLAWFASCVPIDGTPRTLAPMNSCAESACENYESRGNTKPSCTPEGRCETVARPNYTYTFVVSLPTTSFFGAGTTFAVTSEEIANNPSPQIGCSQVDCFALPNLVDYLAEYRVARNAAQSVGNDFGDVVVALPGLLTLRPMVPGLEGADVVASGFGLPLPDAVQSGVTFIDAQKVPRTIRFTALLPPGKYRRILSPAPAFQTSFPPLVSEISATGTKLEEVRVLGESPTELDDPVGTSRIATLRRAGGLDGFRVWLEDSTFGDKVSPTRVLSGTEAKVRLDTVGVTQPDSSVLPDTVDIVLAPPEGSVAMPKLVSGILGGAGRLQEYPRLPPPVSVTGRIVGGGVATKVVFESTKINRLDADPSLLLKYSTEAYADADGAFSTVLPPGIYEARTVPGFSDSFALTTTAAVIGESATVLAPIEPSSRTNVTGMALLADRRPLAAAEVLAIPSTRNPRRPWTVPTAVRTQTLEDGTFALALDQGGYYIVVTPAAGSGFPILVSTSAVSPANEEFRLGELTVPAPIHLRYTIRDPNGNVVQRALVRTFYTGTPGSPSPPIEIGRAMTDTTGNFDMFLSPDGV